MRKGERPTGAAKRTQTHTVPSPPPRDDAHAHVGTHTPTAVAGPRAAKQQKYCAAQAPSPDGRGRAAPFARGAHSAFGRPVPAPLISSTSAARQGRARPDPRLGPAVTSTARPSLCLGGSVQGGFLVRSLVDGAGSYSVARRAGLLPTELTGMWGWILLRSPHQRKGSLPVPSPTKQRPGPGGPALTKRCRRWRCTTG